MYIFLRCQLLFIIFGIVPRRSVRSLILSDFLIWGSEGHLVERVLKYWEIRYICNIGTGYKTTCYWPYLSITPHAEQPVGKNNFFVPRFPSPLNLNATRVFFMKNMFAAVWISLCFRVFWTIYSPTTTAHYHYPNTIKY